MRTWVQSLGSLSGLVIWLAVSCGVGHKHSLDPMLLCLQCRPEATALMQPLAREPPCAVGVALKRQKTKKKKKKIMVHSDMLEQHGLTRVWMETIVEGLSYYLFYNLSSIPTALAYIVKDRLFFSIYFRIFIHVYKLNNQK